jgi:hypothetical protein
MKEQFKQFSGFAILATGFFCKNALASLKKEHLIASVFPFC